MKTISRVILVLIIPLLYNCKNEPKYDGYIIKGNISNKDRGTILLSFKDLKTGKERIIDSATIINGKFQLKNKIEHPDLVTLTLDKKKVDFFIENSEITIDINPSESPYFLNAKIKGSTLQDTYDEFNKQLDNIANDQKYKSLNDISKKYNTAGQNGNTKLQEELYKKLKDYKDLISERAQRDKDLRLNYINDNPNSPISPLIVKNIFSDRSPISELESILSIFKGDAKETITYKYFKQKYNIRKRTSYGQPAPDFALKTPKGKDIALSTLKGKYVLLDFWASWCKPCRASYPHLKKVYEKYKAKGFEVFAISTDRKRKDWLKAIEEDQTTWLQVLDRFPPKKHTAEISDLYSVPFLPTTYLLDKDGIILAKNLKPNELDKKLEEIFGF